jgi:precorrin-6B methylase 2
MARAPASPWGGVLDHTRVSLAQHKVRLELATGHEVFSGAGVDVGTQLLLRTLDPGALEGVRSVFDLGCGYGPLGLALGPRTGSAVLMDRDAVAVAYSRLNAKTNGAESTEVVAGLGWGDLPAGTEPDLMVSNIPAKAGPKVIEQMLVAGPTHRRAVVVIERIVAEVDGVLERSGAEMTLRKANRTHVALHYRVDEGRPAEGVSSHLRGTRKFRAGKLEWEIGTAWGLPEFDTLTHSTGLAIRVLRGVHSRSEMAALVVDPGQGHLPMAILELIRPASLRLCSRDLLALRWTQRSRAIWTSSTLPCRRGRRSLWTSPS